MDPEWMPFLLTPPFPEYPSGHSVQSAAAATVLAAVLGDPYPFTDKTRERDGAIPRSFTGFIAAAKEAGISGERLSRVMSKDVVLVLTRSL